jgi:hypothetical protein
MDLGLKELSADIKKEFRQGSSDMLESLGYEPDRDLRLYQRLGEKDFAAASSVFGTNKVIDYIKRMESKILRRRVE